MNKIKKQYFVFFPVMVISLYQTSLGYLIPAIKEKFLLSLTQVGLFSTLQYMGSMISILLCFSVFSALNKSRIMLIAALGLASLMFLLGINQITLMLYVLFFFIGFFMSIQENLSNAIIVDISKENTSYFVSSLHGLRAALGAAGPVFAIMLGSVYTKSFFGIGILIVIAAVVFYIGLRERVKRPMLEDRNNFGSIKKLIRILKRSGMKILIVAGFFSYFAQISFTYFVSTYAGGIRGLSSDGALVLSLLFAGLFVGRVIYAKLAHRLAVYKIMVISNMVAAAAFWLMLFSVNIVFIAIFAAIGGICLSVTLPGIIVKACGKVSGDTAAASSLIYIGLACACIVAPPIVGTIGDAVGLKIALLVSTSTIAVVAVLSAILRKRFGESKALEQLAWRGKDKC